MTLQERLAAESLLADGERLCDQCGSAGTRAGMPCPNPACGRESSTEMRTLTFPDVSERYVWPSPPEPSVKATECRWRKQLWRSHAGREFWAWREVPA